MLPAKNRITKKEDFDAVYRQSRTVSAGNVVLKFRKNNFEYSRIGIVVGTKFSKLAVERNRIKRQLREIMRAEFKKIYPGWDMVIIAQKKGKSFLSSRELREMVEKVLAMGKLAN